MTTKESLLKALEDKGYTDGVDVDTETSLYEYGIIRNPETNDVLFCHDFTHEGGRIIFDWSTIGTDDVKEALQDAGEGFFSFIGSDLETELNNLSNDYLANIIHSIGQYDGYFSQSCQWDMDETDALNRIKD